MARKFASLDQISGGRSGWNLVTSSGRARPRTSAWTNTWSTRSSARAAEFHDVVLGLWDSWEDDAFLRDADSGQYFDPAKLHPLHHRGEHFKVRGPLNVARSPQGRPVVVQAGASPAGRDPARSAEVIFVAHQTFDEAQSFYRDIKRRAAGYGRDPDSIKVMPGIFPWSATARRRPTRSSPACRDLIHPVVGVQLLSNMIGVDLSGHPVDGPLPELPETNGGPPAAAGRSGPPRRSDHPPAVSEDRRRARHQQVVGTPARIADQLQQWFEEEGADGFNIMSPWLPGGLDDFIELVLPELRRRGLFRREYAGSTLREHLGLARPAHVPASARARPAIAA